MLTGLFLFLFKIAREYRYFDEDHTKTPNVDKTDDPKGYLQQEWEIFVEKECRKRYVSSPLPY